MKLVFAVVSSLCLIPRARGFASHARVPWNYGPLGHLKVSKTLWTEVLRPGELAIDATCGNGHDALTIAKLCLTESSGALYCIDIQAEAIENTRKRLRAELTAPIEQRVHYHTGSHEVFPSTIKPNSVSLICYNLGYLPGKSREKDFAKSVITQTETTIRSIQSAIGLLKPSGLLSITAYPGHPGGQEESIQVGSFLSTLSPEDWRVYSHAPLNRPSSPILFLAYKIDKYNGDHEKLDIRIR